ncbi:hypothetical protein PUN28_020116 [Cardiocondyla obscurior]|uniref:Condensin complex subunit 2 n=1 Tax=Cardiocondyla obscurior TaxID=286306 RepID=A0AAW2EAI6_9HYME
MDSRKSAVHKRIESIQAASSLSPLRRKSVGTVSTFSENDDEAERINRRCEKVTVSSSSSSPNANKRRSMGLGFLANIPLPQMTESINQCIKLSTENKINTKNAFSLEMIDFMTYMVKKQDVNMTNLQVASTSLDVSTKIYGYRVDNLHMEILKIIGGLATNDSTQDEDEQTETTDRESNETDFNVQKKKKKTVRQKICSTEEALRGNIEIIKPMSAMISEEDLQTSDMLYQITLPNHANTGFYHHPYNDVLVDVVEDASESQNDLNVKYTISPIEDFSNSEIGLSYSNFEFLNWSPDDEVEKNTEINDDDGNRFQFDLDASVEQDDDPAPEQMNYFDIDHDDDNNQVNDQNNFERCQQIASRPNAITLNILNAQESEYSFIAPNSSLHWVGLSHWKFLKFPKSAAAGGNTKAACMQAKSRKKKNFEMTYDEEMDGSLSEKFKASHSNKLQAKTAKTEWNTENLTLPKDMHYKATQLMKLYWHTKASIKWTNTEKENEDVHSPFSDRYDYNNPHDTLEYCPNVENDGDYGDDENRDGGNDDDDDCNHVDDNVIALNSQGLTGDNLVVAPKLVKKMPITYCLKAKRIDMRQLKRSIWSCLTSTNDIAKSSENVENMTEPKKFSEVFKSLPKLLSKSNAEALSVPISFISMLHLANEKGLNITSIPDMSDLIIQPGNLSQE